MAILFRYYPAARIGLWRPAFFRTLLLSGLDPRNLEDQYANYWTPERQSLPDQLPILWRIRRSTTDILHSPGIDRQRQLHRLYGAQSDQRRGVITPTAAISSISLHRRKPGGYPAFYYDLGDRLWGEYGFYDAFHPTNNWDTGSFLAIDQD